MTSCARNDQAAGGAASWQSAAEDGLADAQVQLGHCLSHAIGAPRDLHLAAIWYGRAAHQGLAEGQTRLAECFDLGEGVERDERAAAHWYGRAAAQGTTDAQTHLAEHYESGRGVERNLEIAADLFATAAVHGASAEARAGLKRVMHAAIVESISQPPGGESARPAAICR
jgi:TPR repeat protein